MPMMTWSPALETGDPFVDGQHRSLVQMVNEFHDAAGKGTGKDNIGAILSRIATYTVQHFAHEEKLMKESAYPDLPAHKKEHDQLLAKAKELIEGHKTGKVILSVTISQFLQDWLRVHIQQVDKKMIDWVKTHHRKAA